jgi:hypothetical protein
VTDDDIEQGGNVANTLHKIEFLKFDGTWDPMSWLNRCGRYFRLYGTPEHQRIQVASFYLLDDAQVWYHRVKLNGGLPSWNHFVQLIHTRFSPPLTESPIDELALLRRDGSIDEYCNKSMALSCHDPTISENHLVQPFTTGLSHHLLMDVVHQKLATLDEAVMYTQAYRQRDAPHHR